MTYPYRVARTVIFRGKDHAPDTPITFDADDPAEAAARDDLLALGAIDDDPDFAEVEQLKAAAPSEPRPLPRQTNAELLATAAAEGVDVPGDATNAVLIAAIEAKRGAAGAGA